MANPLSTPAQINTDILVVGGGTGGTAAAIQAARRGVKTVLVSEGPWLGGMLTSAGVAAPDGNELRAWQTGLWGEFLTALRHGYSGGLDHSWVSLFTFLPPVGAQILADWVEALPALTWIKHQRPLAVLRKGDRLEGVRFEDYDIRAKVILDGTELGDLLALGNVPHRWGWDWEPAWNEPSAPSEPNAMTAEYPVQSPTWVFILRRAEGKPEKIEPLPHPPKHSFADSWRNHSREAFLTYGQLPQSHYMINWPIGGNDYGRDLNRLLGSEAENRAFLQEAYDYSYTYAHYLQNQYADQKLELATGLFPWTENRSSGFALHPYYRESRRLRGQITITERDLLPQGHVAPLPFQGSQVTSIAVGNYANDHHYPGYDFPLAPKSLRWGGRWTGTPFTISLNSLFSDTVRGYLPCEKNISVSHMANGSTRLQPLVMNTGQAVGMVAALSVERLCDPQEVPVRDVQNALIGDRQAPAAVIPLFNLSPDHPDWAYWQTYYLDHPEAYPQSGNAPLDVTLGSLTLDQARTVYTGEWIRVGEDSYGLRRDGQQWQVITERPEIAEALPQYTDGQKVRLGGRYNPAGNWLVVEALELDL